ncbi:methyl-accepting chemotaxis sensory transducer [Thiorhodococcus drewsii AZ1]|uniref:Methyl-accepting chemotaxis sensory transducer n=1 Tax=Thiorhodococcus drewsii AZ1 TaxID=765913 RepID=G2E7S6_9GAMM|nr:methyl-accepting chemotaxis protein [Thiorhodococcus drewsii]EGV27837.1 methyl-accepting chemotaxis sensory transducer [Thiorhodococcus drewsii AZ1]
MAIDHHSVPEALDALRREISRLSRLLIIGFLCVALLGALLWQFSGNWIWPLGVLIGFAAAWFLRARLPRHIDTLDRLQRERERFFMGILDACEQPCSVTAIGEAGDKEWRWLYVNGPVQAAFGKPLSEFLGKPCYQWGANICRTADCGRECLNRGQADTQFAQDFGAGLNHFRVYTKTIEDLSGQPAYVVEWVDPQDELRFQMVRSSDRVNELSTNTVQSINEVSGNIKSVATAAEELSYSTLEISRSAETAVATVGDVESITQQVGGEAQGAADAIRTLAVIGEEISTMSTVIREIANQTNLLALNASIESARAGEHGRGFAVVASEVKQLAQKTQDATQQIADKSEETRLQIDDNVARIVNLSERVVEASRRVAEVRSEMQSVAASVTEQNAAVEEIARNAAEASQATDEASRILDDVLEASSELRDKVR